MKALEELNNTERGRLLVQLFPSRLPDLVACILDGCEQLKREEAVVRGGWGERNIITADYWFSLVAQAEKLIRDLRYTFERNPKVFSDQLFYSHLAVFTIECITRYAAQKGMDEKFKLAVKLLFL